MSWTVVWNPDAVNALRRVRRDDPHDAAAIVAAVNALHVHPTPAASNRLGESALHRLRLGECRVLYEIDEARRAITVHSVGRIAPTD